MNMMTNIATSERGNPARTLALEVSMALSASSIAPLAAHMAMPVSALVALPTAVEVFARKAGMSADRMIHECLNNKALRDYLAQICIEAEAAL